MLAMMLIAQITVIPAPPPAAEDTPPPAAEEARPTEAEEALHLLRTSPSLANLTNAVFVSTRETSTPVVRSAWRPGDGPFGAFDSRLTRVHEARGSYFASALAPSRLYRPRTITPSRRIYTGNRAAIGPRIPHVQPLRLNPKSRPARTSR